MTTSNRRDEILEALTEGISRLTSSDRWAEWLAMQSRFHHYSFRNTLLILTQRPEATRVAGFRAWQTLGRQVGKGEKAIWILAPVTRKRDDSEAEAQEHTSEPASRVLVGFKPACVFDISQTSGEDLPQVCTRLDGDDVNGAFQRLVAVSSALGFTVEITDLAGETNGDCSFDEHRIRVHAGNAPVQQVKTLAHELGHATLHRECRDRALAELEAESVAYVVCSSLGIASDDYSFGYCASWASGGNDAIAAIKASAERIQRTADAILRAFDKPAELAA